MVSDIHKLNSIISTLEDQAKQVTEFSGLLAAVNDARTQIESSKGLLKETSGEQKQLLKDFQNYFDSLEKRLTVVEKALEGIERVQDRMSDEISSFDMLSPQEFLEGLQSREKILFEHLNKLEEKIEAMGISQQQGMNKISLMLFLATAAILGTVLFFNLT